jgi:hypothetical protein
MLRKYLQKKFLLKKTFKTDEKKLRKLPICASKFASMAFLNGSRRQFRLNKRLIILGPM